jgi:hypothetical protein
LADRRDVKILMILDVMQSDRQRTKLKLVYCSTRRDLLKGSSR